MPENYETYERYGSEDEAEDSEREQKLLLKPSHETQPKWVAEKGRVNPKTLGKRKKYCFRIEIITKSGTREWLKNFESKPENEPGRYAIPAKELSKFNDEYVISISTEKRG